MHLLFAKALTKTVILFNSIRITMAFAIPSRTARSSSTSIPPSYCFGYMSVSWSLQRWQRSQEPIIYTTLQWRRTGCSFGFLQLPLPERIALTAHGKEGWLSNSSSLDGHSKVRKCESWEWKKKLNTGTACVTFCKALRPWRTLKISNWASV